MKRGDVILVRFPHPSGIRGKKRPAVIVQSNHYSAAVGTLVVAEVRKNLHMKDDPACLYIDISTADGATTGLVRNSVVSCLLLVTVMPTQSPRCWARCRRRCNENLTAA